MAGRVAFHEQVVIVTGAGRGIGRAEALEVARRGGRVVVNDKDLVAATTVAGEIEAGGGTAVANAEDVAKRAGGEAIVAAALDAFGTVDAVVNNAGNVRNNYFEDLTEEQIEEVLAVHLEAAFFVTQPAWRVMREKGYGRIVMTGSSSGMFAHQGLANYAAAKAGVYGLAKALAFEGREHGILVNTLMPGAATTISSEDPIPGMDRHWDPDMHSTLAPRRTARAVAPMTAFLASDACTFTGEVFAALAGWYGRVFVAKARGWLAPDAETVTAEEIVEHLEEIRDQSAYTVPRDTFEDMREIASAISRSS